MTDTNPKNISIIWDFDGTLTHQDSTTKVVEFLQESGQSGQFWEYIHSLREDKEGEGPDWEHVLASDAPIWMYALSRVAFNKKVPLNHEFFKEFILDDIELYPSVVDFLLALKRVGEEDEFKALGLHIHHFIVSAGLKELVEQVFPQNLITWTFGCRYTVVVDPEHQDEPESVPVFCMDETMKTRSIFEIVKGSFDDKDKGVNIRVEKDSLWSPFPNTIYIGDGFTDVPALSLVRDRGGLGIAVYDPDWDKKRLRDKHGQLRIDKRADLVTEADFSLTGELFEYIRNRCVQIRQRYEAEAVLD